MLVCNLFNCKQFSQCDIEWLDIMTSEAGKKQPSYILMRYPGLCLETKKGHRNPVRTFCVCRGPVLEPGR